MRVTATKCLKGKRHKWQSLLRRPANSLGDSPSEVKWCKTCGCSTEFYCDLNRIGHPARRSWKRCRSDDGTYDVNIPDCHKSGAEIAKEKAAVRREEREMYDTCVDSKDAAWPIRF